MARLRILSHRSIGLSATIAIGASTVSQRCRRSITNRITICTAWKETDRRTSFDLCAARAGPVAQL
eukprot:8942060-Lingulodinium_polyedra.AAC.1